MRPASVLLTPAEPAGGRRVGTVLVVDDDDEIRAFVADAAEFAGYDVVDAVDGAEALAVLATGPKPCVVLLDMRMPIMDGWTFAQRYRQRPEPHAPIVVMTAAKDARAWAAEVAADGVLPKPFDLTDLDAVLRRFCN